MSEHDSDQFFRDMHRELTSAERAIQRQATFEERVIKRILRLSGSPVTAATAYRASCDTTNLRSINFQWFRQAFPQFPIYLGSQKIPYVHKVQGSQFFGTSFAKLPFFREFRKFVVQEDLDIQREHCGLVFQYPHLAGDTMLVLHNYPPAAARPGEAPDCRTERGTRVLRPYGKPLVVYVIESLKDLLVNVGDHWLAVD